METRVAGGRRRWQSLKEKLSFKGIGCCGSLWAGNPTTLEEHPDYGDNNEGQEAADTQDETEEHHSPEAVCLEDFITAGSAAAAAEAEEMNLAAALAAERQFRRASSMRQNWEGAGTPMKVSLMRLLEEGEEREKEEAMEASWCCCVCMGRRKGAAFIPCGHAFCRVCARELWLNRGACPLCNRPILEILDIF